MKNNNWLLYLAGMIIALISLVSCHHSSPTEPTGLDFTSDSTTTSFPYKLYFYNDEVSLCVPRGKPVPNVEIDGIVRDWQEVVGLDTQWQYTYDLNDPMGFDRHTINYRITIEGTVYSGTLSLPPGLDMHQPAFDEDEDYILTWTAYSNPNCYVIKCHTWGLHPEIVGQYPGSTHSYRVKKSQWDDNPYPLITIDINAINYNRHGDVLLAKSDGILRYSVHPPYKKQ